MSDQLISEAVDHRPDPKVLLVWRWSNAVSYLVFLAIVAVIATVAVTQGASPFWLLAVLSIPLLYLWTAITLRLEWESWTYRLTPDTLEMNHGWWYRKRRVVARDRIQHLDVSSGPFDRRFGLVQVSIHTAGTTVGTIPGLRPEHADALRRELLGG